jgi:hypothetical protein
MFRWTWSKGKKEIELCSDTGRIVGAYEIVYNGTPASHMLAACHYQHRYNADTTFHTLAKSLEKTDQN